jgi:hypothetical protein
MNRRPAAFVFAIILERYLDLVLPITKIERAHSLIREAE